MQVLQSATASGTFVKKGDVVAEFDRQYQLMRLDDFKANVDQSDRSMRRLDSELEVSRKQREQQLTQAQAAVDKAKLDIKTTPVRSDIDAERLKLTLEEAESQLKMVKATLPYADSSERSARRASQIDMDQANMELKRAQVNVDKLLMKAPMDGMTVMQSIRRGPEMTQIQQGDQLFPGQLFMQIVDPGSMLVQATVNQTDVEMVRIGARASLRFDAFPDLTLPAHVVSIGAMTNTAGFRDKFVKEVPVFLKIDKLDPRVIPDLSVSADLVVESGKGGGGVVAPLESVFQDSKESQPYVFVKSGETYQRRQVRLGVRNNTHAEVVEGLRPGEVIALEPPMTGETTTAKTEENVQRS